MAIWNPSTGTWNNEKENEIWDPSNGRWNTILPSKSNSIKRSTKKESKKRQDSFSSATKKLGDTIDNSFTKNNGFSLTNIITDAANIGDDLKNVTESLPIFGKSIKKANKTISNIANFSTNAGEGALRTLEGSLDAINNISDNINSSLEYKVNKVIRGEKKAKDILKERKEDSRKFISRDLVTELQNATGYNDEQFRKNFEKGSLIKRDNLGGQIAQGIGGMVPSLLVGEATAIPLPQSNLSKGLSLGQKMTNGVVNAGKQLVSNLGSTMILGSSSYGQGLQEAYQNGATDEEARRYAIGSTAKEIATEWITGGIPGLNGTGGLDKPVGKLIDKTTGKLKNEYAKAIAKSLMNYGYKFLGEGLEEGLSDIIDPYLKNATYSKNEKVKWEEVLNSFIVGGITGGILEAPNTAVDFRNDIKQAKDIKQQNKAMLPVANTYTVNKNNLQYLNNIEGNPLMNNKSSISLPLDSNTIKKLNQNNQTQFNISQENNNISDNALINSNSNNIDLSDLNDVTTQEQLKSISNKLEVSNDVRNNIGSMTVNNINNRKDNKSIKYVKTEDVMKLFDGGGNRNFETFQYQIDDIRESGIETPIYISKETNKIIDGNHRVFIAQQLGLENIPVKYITSSSEIDLDSDNWYNKLNEMRNLNERNGKQFRIVDEGMQIKSDYNNRSSKSNSDGRRIKDDNRLFREKQENNRRSSDETVYVADPRLGQRVDDISNYLETKQRIFDREAQKIKNNYEREKNKNKKIITKEVSKILEFDDYQQKRKFTDLVSEYYDNPDVNKIKQDIKDNFSEKKIEYVNDYIKEIKNLIRGTDLQITDYVRKNLTDFSDFRKDNFHKLHLKNQGQSIDSFYNELSETYPSVFSKDITNEVDQLERLSEFMNEDDKLYEKYNVDDSVINDAAQYIYDSIKNKDNIDDLINSISISPKQIRKEKTIEYREYAENFVNNSENWVDKKLGLSYKTNTMKRNFYDVMGNKDGSRLYHNYIEPIFNHNAQMQNDISTYNEKIEKLKLNDKESTAVQMLGEYKYNPETLVTGMEVDEFITKNKLDYKKIENAVEVFRSTYDELIERANETLKSQGYKEIEYRKGYFPHFVDEGAKTKFGKILEQMGWKFKDDSVPTDIAGITDTFKPGKVWNRNAQQRKGKYTEFNALKGFDNYVRGAMETIYFTEDIQKLRALENEIRYQHSEKGVQTQIDEILSDTSIDFEERQDKIDKIFAKYVTPLNNLVSEIRDYTNGITNKKSILDRTVEQATNRKIYSVMQNVSSRLSANMVGLNLSSAITNFIPITQATSQVKSKYLLKGLKESIRNQALADNFESKSVFLTSRLKEADRLYKTRLEKFSDKANFMFDGIDSITANTIVRGKYYENIANGMNEYNAIRNADEFARDLMAGRTKGEMPTIFNSKNPLIKLFTSFQLEVNNQFQYMFKDLPRDLGEETKKKLLGAFIKMFFGAWIYNQITDKIVGRKSAFSPADTIKEIYDTSKDRNLNITDKSTKILENLTQDIPFVGGLVGGGRLPISSVANPLNVIKGKSTIKDEAKKALYYTVLPFGGGQLKKTVEGASMYINNKDVKGSYNNKGKLRFEAKKDIGSITQNLLFGQYSSKEAREYFDKSYLPIDSKTIDKLQKQGVSINEYRKYSSDKKELGLNDIKSDKDEEGKSIKGTSSAKKALTIMNSNYSKKEKEYLIKNLSNSENSITLDELKVLNKDEKEYKFYFSLDNESRKKFNQELDNYNIKVSQLIDYYNVRKDYNKNYTSSVVKDKIMSYISNSNLDEKAKWYLYNKDYGSKNLTKIIENINIKSDDYFNVLKYSTDVYYKYKNKNDSTKRKKMVFDYINNLNINKIQKIILFKQAGYSDTSSKKVVFNYIDSLNMSKKEKQNLYNAIY